MARPKKSTKSELARQERALQVAQENVEAIEASYKFELESKPEFSLVVDPENKYKMDILTKEFVRHYIEHRNISTAAMFCRIETDAAIELFTSYPVQQEVRRISRALYHRQFSKKMMSLNDIGGFLSSLIEDSELPEADKLSTKDKLAVVRLLIDLNQLKLTSMQDPSILMMRDVNVLVKDLSVGAIKSMLTQTDKDEETRQVINDANMHRQLTGEPMLTVEETAYLESLSAEEALELLNSQYINDESGGVKDE